MTPRQVPRRRPVQRENLRPPRYRLLSAAAKLPRRPPVEPSVSYQRDCPACGRTVWFLEVHLAAGVEHIIEEHDCISDPIS